MAVVSDTPIDAPILVTGAAGFIGSHVSRRLLEQGQRVIGVDNLTPYYDPKVKEDRLKELGKHKGFRFIRLDLADRDATAALFAAEKFPYVVHLAAQAGVRYSLQNPHAYVDANLQGFVNVLEGCRHHGCRHLLFASSSSVYGANTKLPFSTSDNVDHPISLYAASKKANELMAHTYSHLFRLPATGLRFFTVYGPWGRPDMALFKFTRAMLAGEAIGVYGHGQLVRDFTYIDDIVGAPEYTVGAAAAVAMTNINRHIRWVDTDAHGYAVLTGTPAATQMDWFFVNNRADPRSGQRYGQSWRVPSGTQRVQPSGSPAQ